MTFLVKQKWLNAKVKIPEEFAKKAKIQLSLNLTTVRRKKISIFMTMIGYTKESVHRLLKWMTLK